MGLVRSTICLGLMALSFYAGYKTHEKIKPPVVFEQTHSIEDTIQSLLQEDKKEVAEALYNIGKMYGFEK
jgi:hypothetical protein